MKQDFVGEIQPHPLSHQPHQLFEEYVEEGRIFQSIEKLIGLSEPIKSDFVRFVCISDTHEKLGKLLPRIPAGDVLVHCGDFTNYGDYENIVKFNDELGTLPHKFKIVIAGNHELGFEDGEDLSLRGDKYANYGTSEGYKLLTNCTYLQDSSVEIYGIKIYGSSWHPLPHYSFSRPRGASLLKHWNKIPSNTDILLTHTPPLGHCDSFNGKRRGCAELLNTVEKRVKPKYHIFGHIHEQHGISTNGETTFINAVSCDPHHALPYDPIVFDYPVPKGICKN